MELVGVWLKRRKKLIWFFFFRSEEVEHRLEREGGQIYSPIKNHPFFQQQHPHHHQSQPKIQPAQAHPPTKSNQQQQKPKKDAGMPSSFFICTKCESTKQKNCIFFVNYCLQMLQISKKHNNNNNYSNIINNNNNSSVHKHTQMWQAFKRQCQANYHHNFQLWKNVILKNLRRTI